MLVLMLVLPSVSPLSAQFQVSLLEPLSGLSLEPVKFCMVLRCSTVMHSHVLQSPSVTPSVLIYFAVFESPLVVWAAWRLGLANGQCQSLVAVRLACQS